VLSGQAVTLTATVTGGGSPVSPGTVNFCDASAAYCQGPAVLGTAQLIANGTASIKLISGIGAHSIKAVFVGTNTDAGSSSTAQSLTVTGVHPTSTAIAASGSIGNYTLTATVMGAGTQAPTGTVSFLNATNGNALLGTAPLGTQATAVRGFTQSASLNVERPFDIAVGDFNGDGKPDLAVPNYDLNTVSIFLGNGDDTFTTAASPATGASPGSIAVGDFNEDGKQDLAVMNYDAMTLTILLGNGDGTFTTVAASPATGSRPYMVVVGDFNNDGRQDLAVTNFGGDTLTILLGNGDGTFTAAASPNAGNYPESIAVGDFNGDGKQDLVATNQQDNTVTILLGNGDGTFTSAGSAATGNVPLSVVVGDFNGDGKQDLAVANYQSNTVTILLGNGNGTFTAASSLPSTSNPPLSLAVGDFNQDGKQDLAVSLNNPATQTGAVTILLGNGDGTFTAESVSPATGAYPILIVSGDFNGDGMPDLAVANNNSSTATVLLDTVVTSTKATLSSVSIPDSTENNVEASYPGDANYGNSISGTVQIIGTNAVPVTINTSPQGLQVSVDGGTPQAAPISFLWAIGSQHTISAITPETATGTRYTFTNWSDGGAATHTVTASSSTTSYTAHFSTVYLLTTSTTPSSGGVMFPATSGTYYAAGTVVPLVAIPAPGYLFGGWSGDVASPGSPVTTVTMNAPESVTANFQQSLVVTTAADDLIGTPANCPIGGGGTNCTLRDALAQSAAIGGARITFDATVFAASQPASARTITLLPGQFLRNNFLDIPSNTSIIGPTTGTGVNRQNLVTLNNHFIYPGGATIGVNSGMTNVAISNLTVPNGFSKFGAGGIASGGELTLNGLIVTNNDAYEGAGGGIDNSGTMTIINSTISGNTDSNEFFGPFSAGGIYNSTASTLRIINSTISDNIAWYGGGGAIYNDGILSITGSTISDNGSVVFVGIGTGGIYNSSTGTLTMTNSILAGNGGNQCSGTGCPTNGTDGNIVTATPLLAPLGNYGGPTQTQPPLPGSPAICAGVFSDIPQGVFTDQRGVLRLSGDDFHVCLDSGSVQTQYSLRFSQQPSSTTVGTTITPAPTVQLNDHGTPMPVSGVSIPLSLAQWNNGSLSNGTASTDATGTATYSNLSVSAPGLFDILVATLPLTPSLPVRAVSLPFNVLPATP